MKTWHWVTISAGLVALGLAGVFMVTRGGDRAWVDKAPAKSEDLLRIVTFNVDGLFDEDDDPRLVEADDDVPSDRAHLDAIASAIRAADADVIALQGVESLKAVEWFTQTYLSSMEYAHIASLDVGHERGIENAVLSRFPITDSRVWPTLRLGGNHPSTAGGSPNPMAGKPIMFNRSPLMVTIDVPGRAPLMLFNVEHKGGNKHDYWRRAEAAAIATLCKRAGMSKRIIVLGSFHCDPDDPSMQPYFDAGFIDSLATSGNSEFHATETSGDRTDFVLGNRVVGGDLDSGRGFVLGGDFADRVSSGDAATSHLPVGLGLRVQKE